MPTRGELNTHTHTNSKISNKLAGTFRCRILYRMVVSKIENEDFFFKSKHVKNKGLRTD